MAPERAFPSRWLQLYFGLFIFVWVALWVFPYWREMQAPSFQVGQPAPYTVIAPREVVYIPSTWPSQRPATRNNPQATLYSPDAALFLEFRTRFLSTLDYIDTLRRATHLTEEQKIQDLLLLEHLQLTPQEARSLLRLSETVWEQVRTLSPRLFLRFLQNPRPVQNAQQLQGEILNSLPLDVHPEAEVWIRRLVFAYLLAYYQHVAPGDAREVPPEAIRVYQPGETIVRRGDPVDPSTYEILSRLNVVIPDQGVAGFLRQVQFPLMVLGAWLIILTVHFLRTPAIWNFRALTALQVGFLLILAHVRIGLPVTQSSPWLLFLYPFPLYALLAHLVLGPWTGLVWGWALIASSLVDHAWASPLVLYHSLSTLVAVLALGKPKSLREYVGATLAMVLVATAVLVGYGPHIGLDGYRMTTWIPLTLSYSLLTGGLVLFLEYGLSWMTGRATRLHLMDLARPDHPLLQLLLQRAPGTYQHSLMVGNLAEQAARRIGADALLCRVGALYHDIGKVENPYFFIENQTADMTNPHQDLDPYRSAQILKAHVTKGLELAAQHRLPKRIRDFIAEHHGTTILKGPYMRAVEAAGGDPEQVPLEAFRYPGPRPQSKETAILMLADICEARIRAHQPSTEEEIRALVRESIELRFREGELDESGLSIRELREIEDAFVQVLAGAYHQRLLYPSESRPAPLPPGQALASRALSTSASLPEESSA